MQQLVFDLRYRVIEEQDEKDQLVVRYTYGAGMDEPLTMERGGSTYYYHRDALGSITELTDGSGYTGTAYVQAAPDLGALYATDELTGSPALQYDVRFLTPGTYSL